MDSQEVDYTQIEKEKYTKIWDFPKYRNFSPGERNLPKFLEMTGARPPDSIADFGCGTGRPSLTLATMGFNVSMYDIASNCLDNIVKRALIASSDVLTFEEVCLWDINPTFSEMALPGLTKWDWVYCTDVMEHIPTVKVPEVLCRARGGKGAWFSIHCGPDKSGAMIGEPLHITIKPAEWWYEQVQEALPDYNVTYVVGKVGVIVMALKKESN